MRATQVSAFLENRPGRLLHLLQVLAEANVNIIAHNIVDASDFGIVHMLVDDPQHALEVMRSANMTCSTTTVLQVNVPDEPRGLCRPGATAPCRRRREHRVQLRPIATSRAARPASSSRWMM